MREETLVVIGQPKGKQRPRFSRQNGAVYTPKATKEYEEQVRQAWGDRKPFDGFVRVNLIVNQKIPDYATKKRHREDLLRPCGRKPDLDNVLKIWMDALNGLAYADDSKVTEVHVYKIWSTVSSVECRIGGVV